MRAVYVSLWLIRLGYSHSQGIPPLPPPRFGTDSRLPACHKSQIVPSPSEQGHEPWIHPPFCTFIGKERKELCVYTDTRFHFGQGVSIVTEPKTVQNLLKEDILVSTQYEMPTAERIVHYEAIERPGAGVGLFVKPSHKFTAGDVILIDYPTLILPSGEDQQMIPAHVMNHLRWKGLLQLPRETRARTRSLAQSKGAHVDEIVNIFETNAFTHEKGGSLHDMIFAEAARMNHNCRPK